MIFDQFKARTSICTSAGAARMDCGSLLPAPRFG